MIFENDADDEDDDEEWITDEEDPHQYHTPFLVPMPPTPAELFESDSDDEGPPPLVGEDDDGLPPRPIPNRIQTPAQSRTPLVVPEVYEEYDDDNDSEYNTPPFVGEDSNRHAHPAPLRRSRSGEQRRIPQYTLWSELMTIFGDLPPFGPGGENSVYQAR